MRCARWANWKGCDVSKRSIVGILSGLVLVFLLASTTAAQTTSTLAFTPSPDHSVIAQGVPVVERYELVVTPQGGQPQTALNLAKPTPVNNTISVNVSSYLNGLPAGTYTAVVRAVGPGGQGVSPVSAPFSLTVPAPGAPGTAPTITRSAGS